MSNDRPKDRNQGEGDRESARRYNEHVREYLVRGDSRRDARDARDAVDGPEGPSLEAAEARGKAPAHLTRVEQLRGLARRVRRAVENRIADLGDRLASRRS